MQQVKNVIVKIIQILSPRLYSYRVQKVIERNYYLKHQKLKHTKKILYALTPPPHLSNIGDQAQVVAIYKWIKDNYPDIPIIEANKDECIGLIKPLKRLINSDDLILIHSGGNLGDRGMWSETGRRNIISNFPNNKIVSLPQTIFFSNTEKGKIEKRKTEEIYNKHKALTVIGRDFESGLLAKEMLPNCTTFTLPDFVLYLNAQDLITPNKVKPKGVLFCLRLDNESALPFKQKVELAINMDMPFEYFDTTIEMPIKSEEREKHLKDTLNYFNQFEVIVTDRYHGLIFATMLQKPTIVIPTVDHKLTSAIRWFIDIPQIKLIKLEEITSIKTIYSNLLESTPLAKDWNELYFNKLKSKIS